MMWNPNRDIWKNVVHLEVICHSIVDLTLEFSTVGSFKHTSSFHIGISISMYRTRDVCGFDLCNMVLCSVKKYLYCVVLGSSLDMRSDIHICRPFSVCNYSLQHICVACKIFFYGLTHPVLFLCYHAKKMSRSMCLVLCIPLTLIRFNTLVPTLWRKKSRMVNPSVTRLTHSKKQSRKDMTNVWKVWIMAASLMRRSPRGQTYSGGPNLSVPHAAFKNYPA